MGVLPRSGEVGASGCGSVAWISGERSPTAPSEIVPPSARAIRTIMAEVPAAQIFALTI
jgi:hypothetical protein